MSDERPPTHFWPMAIGGAAGVIGIGIVFGGWLGLAPYLLIAGGVLVLLAALIGALTGG